MWINRLTDGPSNLFPGTFHHFHCSWITHLSETLNSGHLPDDFYALKEQDVISDVLALSCGAEKQNGTGGGRFGTRSAVIFSFPMTGT